MPHRIVIIDKDKSTTQYLRYEFNKAGYKAFGEQTTKEGLIAAYKNRPHVLIIDPQIEDDDTSLQELFEKFSTDKRITRTRLIAFSSLTDPDQIQAAIDMGFDHYLAKEGDAMPNLLDAVKSSIIDLTESKPTVRKKKQKKEKEAKIISDSLSLLPKDDGESGKTVVFISAKGSTGTSSICANLAHMINENQDFRVTLIDLVLPIGSISSIVGYEGQFNIAKAAALSGAETTIGHLNTLMSVPKNWNFLLLAGSPDPQAAEGLDVSRIPVLIDTLKRASDYVFINLGQSLSRISLPVILSADQIVLVLSLDKTTATQTMRVWKYLESKGVRKQQIYMVINRAVGLEGYSKNQVEEMLGMPIPNAFPYMERNFTLANNQHVPIMQKFPDDTITFAMRQAVHQIRERITIGVRIPDYQ